VRREDHDLAGRAAEVAVDYTLDRRHLAKADRRFQLVRDKLSEYPIQPNLPRLKRCLQ
jgi:alkylation response protein AidB-like acyl-CoA dehydrogenase